MGADCSAFALIPLARPEMTSVAVLPAPRSSGAVLMPFTLNDSFDDFAREHKLPDCAVSFLSWAGLWSARASKSGFVPSTMHAEFSDDPDRAVRALLAAGAVRRVKAGVRIAESPCWTLLNAKDVSRDIERERAEAEGQRAAWRAKKQGQRAAKRAEKRERIAAGVPGVSPETNADVPRENPGDPRKPQVNSGHVPGDIAGTSPGTAKTSASDYQDPDQSQSAGVNQIDACAREAPSPETVALVVAGISKKLKRIVTEAEACRAVDVWDRRAEAAGRVIHEPEKFYPTCIGRERRLEAIIAPPPDPLWEQLGAAPEPVPGAHLFVLDSRTRVCAREDCQMPKGHARHQNQGVKTG